MRNDHHDGTKRRPLMFSPAGTRLIQMGLAAGLLSAWMMLSGGLVAAQDAKPAADPPPVPAQTFSAGYEVVWDKLLATFKSFELAVASSDKDNGKMATVPHRYFKISSAKFPPVQEDYRDTYDVQVEKKADKSTQVQIKRKFEFYDRTKLPNGDWVQRDPAPEKTGISPNDIFAALALEIAAAGLPAAR
ncbi:MAG: hypothetical protein AB1515_01370 [Nitrospirota bacterium]